MLLDLYGVGEEQLGVFADGSDVGDSERNTLLRVLMAARRMSFGDWYRWRKTKLPWSEWTETPKRARGDIYQLNGNVTKVTVEKPPPELAERFDIERYWRCELTLDDGQAAIVYALEIPNAWINASPPPQRGGAKGILIKFAGADPGASLPVFVAARAAWYPHTELGDLDMDVGLFDTVEDRTRLQASDGPCFYEMLAAASRAQQSNLLERTRITAADQDRTTIEALFNQPQDQHGKLFGLTGTTERVVEVRLDNREVATAIGIDRYFEIELVTADSQGNPITFCALELPPGMPRGEHVAVDVRVAGFFFKVWSYPTGTKGDKTQFQMAPLLVGVRPEVLATPKADTWFSTLITTVLLVGVIALIGAFWWLNRSDRRARQRLRQRQTEFRLEEP
jgi:hypothetical protein